MSGTICVLYVSFIIQTNQDFWELNNSARYSIYISCFVLFLAIFLLPVSFNETL